MIKIAEKKNNIYIYLFGGGTARAFAGRVGGREGPTVLRHTQPRDVTEQAGSGTSAEGHQTRFAHVGGASDFDTGHVAVELLEAEGALPAPHVDELGAFLGLSFHQNVVHEVNGSCDGHRGAGAGPERALLREINRLWRTRSCRFVNRRNGTFHS